MREHPVPQDITNYQFHIIGDMTIKQFAEVAAGCVVGVVIYATNLPALLKWPMIFIFVALGAMAAFVPIEEQPVDHWILVFIKALYKPTKFYWRKEAHIPPAFRFEPSTFQRKTQSEVDLTPAKRERIKQFMSSIEIQQERTAYEDWEDQYLDYISKSFDTVSAQQTQIKEGFQKPAFSTQPRTLGADPTAQQSADTAPGSLDQDASSAIQMQQRQQQAQDPTAVAQDIDVPENMAVDASQAQGDTGQGETVAQPEEPSPQTQPDASFTNTAPAQRAPRTAEQDAATNRDLPFPKPPSVPDRPVGMVLTQDNDLIEGAVVEFHNANTGAVARAVKTNKLGQFFTSSALPRGEYVIHTQKPGFQFQDSRLILQGAPVPPLEIRGTATTTAAPQSSNQTTSSPGTQAA